MKRLTRLVSLFVLVPALWVGCDDDEPPPPKPKDAVAEVGGMDARSDALDTGAPDLAGDTSRDATDAGADVPDTRTDGVTTDTPADRPPETTTEAAPEVRPEAAPEATPEVSPEAAPEAPADATADVVSDAAVDALPVPDGGAGEQVFLAALSGAEENPAVATLATGSATFVLNAAKTMVAYTLRHNVIGATAAHLHTGFGGQNGPVSVALTDLGAESSGTLALTPVQAAALEAGQIYLNIHTAAFAGGEIRGQLLKPGEALYAATLSATNEVPTVSSTAGGSASFILNAAKTEARYSLRHTVTGATAAHLHTGYAYESGPVAVAITPFSADSTGTVTLTAGQATDLESGKLYVNVHSAANAGGEIRGQVVRPGETVFVARLSGANEVPAVGTVASGNASLLLNFANTAVRYNLRHTVVAATAAHLHSGGAGENGPVAVPIAPLTADSNGTLGLTPTQAADLGTGKIYVNVHSAPNANGEIRGQVLRPGEVVYVATLTGTQEASTVATLATGTGSVILDAAKLSIRYRVTTANLTATMAHFHKALAKVSGDVVYGITPLGATMEGTQAVTAANVTDLDTGLWYINVHTAANPGGEIRGQLTLPGAKIFVATLTGLQEVPVVTTANTGNGMVILAPTADEIRYHVTTSATPTLAHFHKAPGGVSGTVEIPIDPVGMNMTGTKPVTVVQVADLERGLHYINIHTAAFGSGELRGQVLGIGETLYTSVLNGAEEVPPVTTAATGGIGYILNAAGTQLRYDGSVTGLTPTAAHIHIGTVGVAGAVLYTLTLAGTSLAGTQAVTVADLPLLNAAGWYTNVHTAANAGGEIRGQVVKK